MNGPTLKQDLNTLDCSGLCFLTANHFADTELFIDIKPRFYVFSDPYFWRNDVSTDLHKSRIHTFENISKKTNWKMTIYVPNFEAKKFVSKYVKGNENVSVSNFNGYGYPIDYNIITHFFWRNNYFAPAGQNVLIHSLYIATMLAKKKVYIVGANFSFHQQISVDQKNNKFYKLRKHVYGESKELAYTDFTKAKKARVSDEFKAIFTAFSILDNLSLYSNKLGIKILNKTHDSYLDMFDR